MTGWAQRRFWTAARAVAADGGYTVHLDEHVLRTPAKAPLVLPSAALAEAIAAEWDAQQGELRPASMPLTRAANATIDRIIPHFQEVAAMVAGYGESDLLCYRAEAPAGLAARQAAAWDPLLAWAAECLDAPLAVTAGLMPRRQPDSSLVMLRRHVSGLDPFALSALWELVSLSGSLVIGLAALRDLQPAEELWWLSRIDETWQEEHWGQDAEAVAAAARRRADFLAALHFHRLSRAAPLR